jgi:hypothetical protein
VKLAIWSDGCTEVRASLGNPSNEYKEWRRKMRGAETVVYDFDYDDGGNGDGDGDGNEDEDGDGDEDEDEDEDEDGDGDGDDV